MSALAAINFCSASNIGLPFKQLGRQSRRNLRRQYVFVENGLARNSAGILS